MKKIAIFVEGETELEFIFKLLIEIADKHRISIDSYRFQGGGRLTGTLRTAQRGISHVPASPSYEALIYNCTNDTRVISDIDDQAETLRILGFDRILGLRDLRGTIANRATNHSDLPFFEIANRQFEQSLPLPSKIVIAVMELETWFLAETNHYRCIHSTLTETFVQAGSSILSFDPYRDDLTLIQDPAESLNRLYGLIGKSYKKTQKIRGKTIKCLDYAHLYITIRSKIPQLDELITEIDTFLT